MPPRRTRRYGTSEADPPLFCCQRAPTRIAHPPAGRHTPPCPSIRPRDFAPLARLPSTPSNIRSILSPDRTGAARSSRTPPRPAKGLAMRTQNSVAFCGMPGRSPFACLLRLVKSAAICGMPGRSLSLRSLAHASPAAFCGMPGSQLTHAASLPVCSSPPRRRAPTPLSAPAGSEGPRQGITATCCRMPVSSLPAHLQVRRLALPPSPLQ
jgi:hypothetical protein